MSRHSQSSRAGLVITPPPPPTFPIHPSRTSILAYTTHSLIYQPSSLIPNTTMQHQLFVQDSITKPVFVVEGRNARERRRIRRQLERLAKAMTEGSSDSSPTSSPAARLSPKAAPFTPRMGSPPLNASLPRQALNPALLWGYNDDPTAKGFPSSMSVPGRLRGMHRRTMSVPVPSSILLGCDDPEVDHLSDLASLIDTSRDSESDSWPSPFTNYDSFSDSSSAPATPPQQMHALPPALLFSAWKPLAPLSSRA